MERRTTMRKLLMLLAVLTVLAASLSTPVAKKAYALICCSACEDNPNTPPCRHGCSPSC
jgi:hypothetical protein